MLDTLWAIYLVIGMATGLYFSHRDREPARRAYGTLSQRGGSTAPYFVAGFLFWPAVILVYVAVGIAKAIKCLRQQRDKGPMELQNRERVHLAGLAGTIIFTRAS